MDITLHTFEQGSGEPLILLHGNGQDLRCFRRQIAFFGRYYHVIAVDTRGHGASPRGDAPFSIEQFADDLYDLLRSRQLDKILLLGFSDGGNIALCFALKHPELVRKLVLNSANLYPDGLRRSFHLPIRLGYKAASRFADRSDAARTKADLLGLMVNEPNIRPEALQTLTAPTLVIAGTKDLILKKHTQLIHQSIPNSEIRFLRGTHAVLRQRPDAFNEAVLQFLQKP